MKNKLFILFLGLLIVGSIMIPFCFPIDNTIQLNFLDLITYVFYVSIIVVSFFYLFSFFSKKRRKGILFISYSPEDENKALSLRGKLQANGYICYPMPNSKNIGDLFVDDKLMHWLDKSESLLVLVSEHSIGSSYVLFTIKHMIKQKKKVLPIRIDDSEMFIPLRKNIYATFREDEPNLLHKLLLALKNKDVVIK